MITSRAPQEQTFLGYIVTLSYYAHDNFKIACSPDYLNFYTIEINWKLITGEFRLNKFHLTGNHTPYIISNYSNIHLKNKLETHLYTLVYLVQEHLVQKKTHVCKFQVNLTPQETSGYLSLEVYTSRPNFPVNSGRLWWGMIRPSL